MRKERLRALAARAVFSVVLVSAAAAALTSCSVLGAQEPVLGSTPAVTETAKPPFKNVARPTPSLSPAPQLTLEETRGLESTPWEPVDAAGSGLTIRYVAGGGCSTFAGVRVHETQAAVEIWTAVKTDHDAQACAAYLSVGATSLQLKQQLGQRALLHAPISLDWKTFVDNF